MVNARTQVQGIRRPDAWNRVLASIPWWLVVIVIGGASVLFSMLSSQHYVDALRYLARGVGLTLALSLSAYAVALVLGLVAGLGRVSRNRLIHTVATVYVEVVRGVPL